MSKMWRKTSKWPYLNHMASKRKSESTFFSSTFKVEENKVPSFFRFVASGLRYCHLLIFLVWLQIDDINKMTKWQYLSPQAKNLKNKGTFFSPTLKVEERKVPSDFSLEAIWLSYGHFDVFLHIFDIF